MNNNKPSTTRSYWALFWDGGHSLSSSFSVLVVQWWARWHGIKFCLHAFLIVVRLTHRKLTIVPTDSLFTRALLAQYVDVLLCIGSLYRLFQALKKNLLTRVISGLFHGLALKWKKESFAQSFLFSLIILCQSVKTCRRARFLVDFFPGSTGMHAGNEVVPTIRSVCFLRPISSLLIYACIAISIRRLHALSCYIVLFASFVLFPMYTLDETGKKTSSCMTPSWCISLLDLVFLFYRHLFQFDSTKLNSIRTASDWNVRNFSPTKIYSLTEERQLSRFALG